MPKLVVRLHATAALWVRIQTSLKKTKWATQAKEWSTQSSLQKIYKIKRIGIGIKPGIEFLLPVKCQSG